MNETATAEGPLRVYKVRDGVFSPCIATCDLDSLGFCLLTLREEGQIEDQDHVGIMYRPSIEPGFWIVNPFNGEAISPLSGGAA